ncbi:MAG: shikimate kinase [Schleiferiaceae bacterium]|nr:shikimate kinase [Schleiferiaceae bacterium]
MNQKIALIGYMGSGKTKVGKQVASLLNYEFIDLDAHLEAQLGSSIAEIITKKGELFFRKAERALLLEILSTENSMVLATGGGTPCYYNNMDVLIEHCHCIYLSAPVGVLYSRLKNDRDHRPLIAHLSDEDLKEFIGKHLFERTPFYQKAHQTLPALNATAKSIVDAIKFQKNE